MLFPARSERLGLAPPTPDAEFVIRVLQEQSVLASAGIDTVDSRPSETAVQTITAHGASWTVQVWTIAESSNVPAFVLIVGLLLAFVVAAVAARRELSVESAATEAESRAQELALIARTGPMLQQSLEFSDLFPVFVVEISDELALENVSISMMSDTGGSCAFFSWFRWALTDVDPSDWSHRLARVGAQRRGHDFAVAVRSRRRRASRACDSRPVGAADGHALRGLQTSSRPPSATRGCSRTSRRWWRVCEMWIA